MATVTEICEVMARSANMPLDDVKKYARALVNSGDLPKAVGRAVPHTDMHHRAKLILAIAASDRANDCVVAMRQRYEATLRHSPDGRSFGDILADELRELSDKSLPAYQKWLYSNLTVSRSEPTVTLRINENIRNYEPQTTSELVYVGRELLFQDIDGLIEIRKKYKDTGLPVSAFVSGRILIALAFGSLEAWELADREISIAFDAINNPSNS